MSTACSFAGHHMLANAVTCLQGKILHWEAVRKVITAGAPMGKTPAEKRCALYRR